MKDLADPDTGTEAASDASGADLHSLMWDAEAAEASAEEAEATVAEARAAAAEAKAVAAAARARARATLARQRADAAGAPASGTTETGADSDTDSATAPVLAETSTEATPSASAAAAEVSEATPSTASEASAASDEVVPRKRLRTRLTSIPRRAGLILVAVVLIIASLGTGGYTMWHHHKLAEQNQRSAEFTAAARQGVVALTSMDFNHAKDDVQRVLDDSTGSFHDDFQGRADDFTKVVQQSQVVTEGKVDASAVESMSGDSAAVVLVAATSQITNSAGAKQEPRVWRLSVTVSRVGGQLKMSKVEFVP